jgi:hypothetical protein
VQKSGAIQENRDLTFLSGMPRQLFDSYGSRNGSDAYADKGTFPIFEISRILSLPLPRC